MAVWTAPITWTAGDVTIAEMNSIRDNLVWLKAALDVITNATASDVAGSTFLQVIGTGDALIARVTGDAGPPRFAITTSGEMFWSDGANPQDVALSRLSARLLYLDDAQLRVNRTVGANPALSIAENDVVMLAISGGGRITFSEQATTPAAPGTNDAVLYAQDNGSGKTQLLARFNTGAVQVLATQP